MGYCKERINRLLHEVLGIDAIFRLVHDPLRPLSDMIRLRHFFDGLCHGPILMMYSIRVRSDRTYPRNIRIP